MPDPRAALGARTKPAFVVKGEWMYLYRAVDKAGTTVDFYMNLKRDVNAAKAFLRKAMKGQRVPAKITLVPKRVIVRSSKYLNNLIPVGLRAI